MLTKTMKDLIKLCKAFGMSEDSTVGIMSITKTDEIREQLIQEIIDRYDKKGTVTEDEINVMAFMLSVPKKKTP